METDLLNVFNRFANYLEKSNSGIYIKIVNDNIMFNDRTYVFDGKYVNIDYTRWFITSEKIPLELQINCFFFGRHCESIKKFFSAPIPFSIFEYCNMYSIVTNQLALFGCPSCIEELLIKMDLMEI